ncbi:MAG: glycosyltransferase family 2 protein [Candidatus Woesebacteria bacterium]|nr:MAG: glycosyltransferase family 2 protein [Candidatus Woesebacteria bacterium]
MEIKISSIIIAKNEEKMIKDCINSLHWTDEIIVIDNNSTDKTVSIAKNLGAKIFKFKSDADKGHFAEIREYAATKANSEWLLYIDADERVPENLKKEIMQLNLKDEAYAIPRKNNLLGHDMSWGGWYPDYVLRLIKKDKLKGFAGVLHEQPIIDGEVGKLKNPLYHITHQSITEMIEKTNNWSEIEGRLMYDAGHPPMNIPRFASAMFREFWYRAILKFGFLDGPIGIIEIIYQVFSRFISYSKLYELQITKQDKK